MTDQDLTPEAYKAKRDEILKQWEDTKVTLETAKAAEMELRKTVMEFCFDPEKTTGTETIELANGYKLKCVKKINYNVDQEMVNEALDKIENLDSEGKFIVERVIKWKADLSLTEYKGLPDRYKAIIDTAITTSEGAPTLTIVAPANAKRV